MNNLLSTSFFHAPWMLAFFGTVAISFVLIRFAVPWGFLDLPDLRKVHTVPTPRTGGIAMAAGCLFSIGVAVAFGWMPWPALPWQTWAAGLGFILLGGLDDRHTFRPKSKFWVMLGISAMAAYPWSRISSAAGFEIHFGASAFHLPPSACFTLLTVWFMAVPNAVNIEDAINGYMGGFTLIALAIARAMGLETGIFMGALAGFLVLNWPRAKHFMGDAGSFGCGFVIAESLLRTGGLARPGIALIITAPISLDVLMGMARRKRLGQSLFQDDRSTCPHHLFRLLGSASWATPLLWINALAFYLNRSSHIRLAIQIACYLGMLIFLNRSDLFRLDSKKTPDSVRP